MLFEHFDELVDMLNNPQEAVMSVDCLHAMARLFDDMSGLLQQPSSRSAFTGTPAVPTAAPIEVDGPNSRQTPDGAQQRFPISVRSWFRMTP